MSNLPLNLAIHYSGGLTVIERFGLTRLPIGNVVIFAIPDDIPTALFQHLGKHASAFRYLILLFMIPDKLLHLRPLDYYKAIYQQS